MPALQSANRKQFMIASEAAGYGTDACAVILAAASSSIIYQDFESGAELTNRLQQVTISRARGSASGVAQPPPIPDRCELSAVCALTGRRAGSVTPEAPWYSDLLLACGFERNITGGEAIYTPTTKGAGSISCYQWTHDLNTTKARLEWGTGIRGNGVFQFALNQEAKLEFEGQGRYGNAIISDAADFFDAATGALELQKDGSTAVPSRTGGAVERYADGPIMLCTSMTITAGGETICISELTLDLGWGVEVKNCMGAAANLREAFLTRGDDGASVGGSFNLADDDAAYDLLRDRFLDATEIAMQIVLTEGDGSSGKATITFDMPKVQIGEMTKGAEGSMRTHAVPFRLNGDWTTLAADNELVITYGEVA